MNAAPRKARCRGPHRLIRVEEYNALGAVCYCMICKQTWQIPDAELHSEYYHCRHLSDEGPDKDADIFIHEELYG